MAGKKYRPVPAYYGFRIYFISTLMFMFLVFPITGILLIKHAPDLQKYRTGNYEFALPDSIGISSDTIALKYAPDTSKNDSSKQKINFQVDSTYVDIDLPPGEDAGSVEPVKENVDDKMTGHFSKVSNLWFKLLFISFFLGLAFNLPFKLYLRKKRRNKKIKEGLFKFCKKYILKTPIINAGILFITYGITSGFMLYQLLFHGDFNEITIRFYKQFFFIMIVSSILNLMFVYFWQKHRVHIKYLEFFFTPQELRKRIFNIKVGRIRNRLWISSAMTTFLPLLIVLFYMLISITNIEDLLDAPPTEEQTKILIGKYTSYFGETELNTESGIIYVNLFDTYIMLIGTFSGIMISFFYLLLFIRWTTRDIVYPVRELLLNMQRTGRGEMESYSIVRTNDEIGELTEGYNDMSGKLKDYIENISIMNEANSRFVPRQFLEYLGKESIADIQLGDQVQKEMTVLFNDIRDFTTISEQMTPKENFNFLNNYLGYMEPVIRNNSGFVDKYIGDSIMALFPDNTEDAINASIEMRIKLAEFNHIINQFGQQAIDSGIGIHTGSLMLGIVGGEGRMEGTVISDAVNLASRLEGLTKVYGSKIIITEETLIKINDPTQYHYRFLDVVKVKGKKEAVYIFEIIDGDPEDIRDLKSSTKDKFNLGMQHYKNKQLKDAIKIFREVKEINQSDLAAALYIKRCEKLIEFGIPPDWDGIERYN
ncbi:MAG: adenylate/guanylate cyclase domain-containing protein [Bacteroidales bacterium]|jgi:class 3 adenylate cyclase|nr:adenylate/guanylate cyclase domain-containing protein [Bacteroidales bacterium]